MLSSAAELHAALASDQTVIDAYLTPGTHLLGTSFVVSNGKQVTIRSDGAVLDAQERCRHFLVQDGGTLELEGTAGPGELTFSLQVRRELHNFLGSLHGGAMASATAQA